LKNKKYEYSFLNSNKFCKEKYCLISLREEDIELIRIWRNEQIPVLRQKKVITKNEQYEYFLKTIMPSFITKEPECILFSFIIDQKCIGYGGFVNIDWTNQKSEISFLLDTNRVKKLEIYQKEFEIFLKLIIQLNKKYLKFATIFTETYDFRLEHIKILEKIGFKNIKKIMTDKKDHHGNFLNSIIHEKMVN
jgi:hypothetical protein